MQSYSIHGLKKIKCIGDRSQKKEKKKKKEEEDCGDQLNPVFKLHYRRPGPISNLICTNSVRKGQAQYPV